MEVGEHLVELGFGAAEAYVAFEFAGEGEFFDHRLAGVEVAGVVSGYQLICRSVRKAENCEFDKSVGVAEGFGQEVAVDVVFAVGSEVVAQNALVAFEAGG